jgi:hypothetical protein
MSEEKKMNTQKNAWENVEITKRKEISGNLL